MTAADMRVLIVDDEPVARQRLRRLLSEIEGVQLIGECKNGRDAVAKITEDRPDLVLLDVQMPMMDGFAVLRSVPEDAMPIVIFHGVLGSLPTPLRTSQTAEKSGASAMMSRIFWSRLMPVSP